eukprot:CAMPEP_0118686736 /NCGR_PEP_ID=MMETSP0800-20121206/7986_1 /TAXON_ID=210618 ORGANISM="Striatella unipunctata, Strain CCMP2910" /NCGR_SAMPLE_ID=MMETSP0800 /ASSEMBLY_ACC=CAM_ASM_000638 /LENGTH=785 /DNA_ID=CAMNT_0006583829 /DNA_START=243 /DNA_END=2600 /DNA_ORIENTATION=+
MEESRHSVITETTQSSTGLLGSFLRLEEERSVASAALQRHPDPPQPHQKWKTPFDVDPPRRTVQFSGDQSVAAMSAGSTWTDMTQEERETRIWKGIEALMKDAFSEDGSGEEVEEILPEALTRALSSRSLRGTAPDLANAGKPALESREEIEELEMAQLALNSFVDMLTPDNKDGESDLPPALIPLTQERASTTEDQEFSQHSGSVGHETVTLSNFMDVLLSNLEVSGQEEDEVKIAKQKRKAESSLQLFELFHWSVEKNVEAEKQSPGSVVKQTPSAVQQAAYLKRKKNIPVKTPPGLPTSPLNNGGLQRASSTAVRPTTDPPKLEGTKEKWVSNPILESSKKAVSPGNHDPWAALDHGSVEDEAIIFCESSSEEGSLVSKDLKSVEKTNDTPEEVAKDDAISKEDQAPAPLSSENTPPIVNTDGNTSMVSTTVESTAVESSEAPTLVESSLAAPSIAVASRVGVAPPSVVSSVAAPSMASMNAPSLVNVISPLPPRVPSLRTPSIRSLRSNTSGGSRENRVRIDSNSTKSGRPEMPRAPSIQGLVVPEEGSDDSSYDSEMIHRSDTSVQVFHADFSKWFPVEQLHGYEHQEQEFDDDFDDETTEDEGLNDEDLDGTNSAQIIAMGSILEILDTSVNGSRNGRFYKVAVAEDEITLDSFLMTVEDRIRIGKDAKLEVSGRWKLPRKRIGKRLRWLNPLRGRRNRMSVGVIDSDPDGKNEGFVRQGSRRCLLMDDEGPYDRTPILYETALDIDTNGFVVSGENAAPPPFSPEGMPSNSNAIVTSS